MTERTTDKPVQPDKFFALRHSAPPPNSMPWLCSIYTPEKPDDPKVGGPVLFRSPQAAQAFASARGEYDFTPEEISRQTFYKIAAEALKDGFNAIILNPHPDGGKINFWQIAQVISSLPRNDPCPCGSGQKTKHCCAAPPPHRYTPRYWPTIRATPRHTVSGENQGKNEPTTEQFQIAE